MRYSSLILAGLICITASVVHAEDVVRVIDGDSIVLIPNREVRLFGIDAPEYDQPYGEVAKIYLKKLVEGQSVQVSECFNHKDSRDVCILTLNDGDKESDIGELLVKAGYAHDYPKYSKGRYAKAEAEAKVEQRGMWKPKVKNQKPWLYRRLKK